MDPEMQKILFENLELARENNTLLKRIRKSQKATQYMSMLYWLIILASVFGAFYFLQPYLGKFESIYNQAQTLLNQK